MNAPRSIIIWNFELDFENEKEEIWAYYAFDSARLFALKGVLDAKGHFWTGSGSNFRLSKDRFMIKMGEQVL
jgi:hypothetical protein